MYCKTPGTFYKSYLLNIWGVFTCNFFYALFCKQINSVKQRTGEYVMLTFSLQRNGCVSSVYNTRNTECECAHVHLPQSILFKI